MNTSVEPIPAQYRGAIPYLSIKGAATALEFYKKAFGAVETMRFEAPSGKIGHAEIKIGDATLMLADEFPEMGNRSPKTLGGSPVHIMIYVREVDRFIQRAVEAGAMLKRPVADQFYGDRGGGLEDPYGHEWWFATHIEDVSEDELQRRAAKMAESG